MDLPLPPVITPEQLQMELAFVAATPGATPPLIIDVRRSAAWQNATDMIGTFWRRDPELLASWSGDLPSGRTIVVYCVHGHEVSQNVARGLCAAGLSARFLDHGIEGWRAAGGSMQARTALEAD